MMNGWMNDLWNTGRPSTSLRPQITATNVPTVQVVGFLFPFDRTFPPIPSFSELCQLSVKVRMNHALVNDNAFHHYKIWNKAFKTTGRRKDRFACVWQWMCVTADSWSNHQKPNKTSSFLRNIYQLFEDLQIYGWTLHYKPKQCT